MTSAPLTAAPPDPPPDRLMQVTLLLLSALTIMAGATIAPSLPAMQAHFASVPHVELLVKLALTIVGLVIAVTAPLSGLLADRFGRRPVLLGSLLLYGLGGASGLLVPSIDSLLVGRVVLGLAVAGTMTAAGALVNDLFTGTARGKFLSQQAAFSSFGGAVLLPLGGLLAGLNWRAPFALYLLAFLLIPLVRRLPRGVPGGVSVLEATQTPRWFSVGVVYLLALSYMVAFYVFPAQGPFYFRHFGVSPAVTGLLLGGSTLVAAITSLLYSRHAGRYEARIVAGLGMLLLAVGLGSVAASVSLPFVVAGLIVAGLGAGLVFPNLYTWLAELTPPAWRGRVTAGMSSAIFLGQFLSPLLLAAPQAHPAQGFVRGGLGIGVIGLVLIVVGMRRRPQQR